MWYDKLSAPPRMGSIQEVAAATLWSMHREAEMQRTYTMVVASFLSPDVEKAADKLGEVWIDFVQAFHPYLGDIRAAKLKAVRDEFESMNKEPLKVTPLKRR